MVEGSYQELQSSGLDFTKLLGSPTETAVFPTGNECENEKSIVEIHSAPKSSATNVASSAVGNTDNVPDEPINVTETCSSGSAAFDIYSSYIFAGGSYCKVLSLLSVCVLTQILASGSDYWITYW